MNTKLCPKCKDLKALSEFYRNRASVDGLQSYCKLCTNKAAKLDYQINNRKDLFIKRGKIRQKYTTELCNLIKRYNGCAFCDEKEVCCMDFHHLDPSQKDMNVSLLRSKKSKDRIIEEMKKCIVVCSNCHRKIHAGLLVPLVTQLCKFPENFLINIDIEIKNSLKNFLKPTKVYNCPECGKFIKKGVKLCQECRKYINHRRIERPNNRKVIRPSKEDLKKLLWEKPTMQLAKDFGVSDVAIAKWAKSYGISKPPRGYWIKLKFGKEI